MNEDNDIQDRYKYMISTIKENQQLWLLQASDGLFAMTEDQEGNLYIPIWPDKGSAIDMAEEEWENYTPEKMSNSEFFTWIDELKQDQVLIGAFPSKKHDPFSINPEIFKNSLK